METLVENQKKIMNYFTYEERLKYILELAEKGQLLSVNQVAGKFGCSEATIKRMIRNLKQKGHPVRYSSALKKFYLDNKGS
jgi:DeoR/GlpR family transcriptional regulator of sugar metabolism